MSAARMPVFPSSPGLYKFLSESYLQLDSVEMSIERLVVDFRDECLAERERLRSAILADALALAEPSSATGTPGTCPYFLTYRFHKGALDVYWLRSSFTSGPHKQILRRVEMASGHAALRVLLAEAHPDEVETIRRHEAYARVFREQWKEYAELKRRLKSFMDGHLKAG